MFQILIVEDDKNTRKLMEAVLKENGYYPIPAKDGMEALRLLDTCHIDLVIMDIMLPGLDGYELTRQLRETHFSLPILMVTAKQLPEDKKKGFIVGTDDYMIKPVDEEEMILRIKALLRRAQIVNEHRITLGPVVLDYDALTVCPGRRGTDPSPERILPAVQASLLSGQDFHPGPADGRNLGHGVRVRRQHHQRACQPAAQALRRLPRVLH